MRRFKIYHLYLLTVIALLFTTSLSSELRAEERVNSRATDESIVYKMDIKESIAPGVWHKVKKALSEADSIDASLFIIDMNTYGGTVVDADSIRTALLSCSIPTYVFINNNAASAGALISIACDSIYMKSGASIGAVTVVNQTGEKMPDKYQSYMRATIRSTAEAQGKRVVIDGTDTISVWRRSPSIAEAMVDESLYIAGVSDSGRVLSFTPSEAILHGFCEAELNSIEEVISQSGISDYEIVEFQPSLIDIIIGLLTNPMVSGILIMGIIGGLYFELQSPGIGFPLIISILAAILYFAPLYIEGLAQNWEILLFIVGLILIAVEIFVIPGFGVAGVTGIVLLIVSLTLSLIDNIDFTSEQYNTAPLIRAFITVSLSTLFGVIGSIYLAYRFIESKSSIFGHIALNSTQLKSDGFVAANLDNEKFIGESALVVTPLKPSGFVEIESRRYSASSTRGFIERGKIVSVIRFEAGQLYVKEIK